METAKIIYSGDLRTTATHILSGTTITTDAPLDNNGKGSSFSPTDLLSTSLACCMLTIIGIKAAKHQFETGVINATVTKIMGSDPRRVIEIKVEFYFLQEFTSDEKVIIEEAALNCPVSKSLHPDIHQNVTFHFIS